MRRGKVFVTDRGTDRQTNSETIAGFNVPQFP